MATRRAIIAMTLGVFLALAVGAAHAATVVVFEGKATEKHKVETPSGDTPSGDTPSGDTPSGDRNQPDDGDSAANTTAQPVGESRLPTVPSQESTSKTDLPAAPVVIFPKSGAITLLSDEEAALNQAETAGGAACFLSVVDRRRRPYPYRMAA